MSRLNESFKRFKKVKLQSNRLSELCVSADVLVQEIEKRSKKGFKPTEEQINILVQVRTFANLLLSMKSFDKEIAKEAEYIKKIIDRINKIVPLETIENGGGLFGELKNIMSMFNVSVNKDMSDKINKFTDKELKSFITGLIKTDGSLKEKKN